MNPYHKLDELKHRLDVSRPLPPEVVRNLHEAMNHREAIGFVEDLVRAKQGI